MSKRKSHSGEFKAEIVLKALSGESTVARLAAMNDINPSMLHKWIKEAKAALPGLFDGKTGGVNYKQEQQIKVLHEKIGQLTVERDLLAELCGRNALKKNASLFHIPVVQSENGNKARLKT